jgi:SAM-dependent methyltransferase
MPISSPETKPWIAEKILEIDPTFVLDVGAGAGAYSDLLIELGFTGSLNAVEVWTPYIKEFNLNEKYDYVYNLDVRDVGDFAYDLVIFGDVLEHMTKEDALRVWSKVAKQARYAIIAIPIVYSGQGEVHGNPYEEHRKPDWTHNEVMLSFSHIVDSWQGIECGAYLAKF